MSQKKEIVWIFKMIIIIIHCFIWISVLILVVLVTTVHKARRYNGWNDVTNHDEDPSLDESELNENKFYCIIFSLEALW